MGVTPTLVPDNAAVSVARRIETIRQCEAYVRDVAKRYAQSKEFSDLIARHGVAAAVAAIVAKGG